jgi:hypothetical protein
MFTGLQVRGNVAKDGPAVDKNEISEESKAHTGVGVASTGTYLAGMGRLMKLSLKLTRPRVVQECSKFPQKLARSTARWRSLRFPQNLVRIVVRGKCSLVHRSLLQRLPPAVITPASSQIIHLRSQAPSIHLGGSSRKIIRKVRLNI